MALGDEVPDDFVPAQPVRHDKPEALFKRKRLTYPSCSAFYSGIGSLPNRTADRRAAERAFRESAVTDENRPGTPLAKIDERAGR